MPSLSKCFCLEGFFEETFIDAAEVGPCLGQWECILATTDQYSTTKVVTRKRKKKKKNPLLLLVLFGVSLLMIIVRQGRRILCQQQP